MPDSQFALPRLAQLYDHLDSDRSDLDHYLAIVDELGARSVLDIGCGTGTFACLLADHGVTVVGVDPAQASLDVAQQKEQKDDAARVEWVLGDATQLPQMSIDLAVMTGNVAQVFTSDAQWAATLAGIRSAVAPEGHLVFETRDPERRAWEQWTRDRSWSRTEIPGIGPVEAWVEVTDVALPYISFRWTYEFVHAGDVLTSDSTLRFRDRAEIESSLRVAGFWVHEVRDAPDRPGKEFVFIAGARPAR